MRNRTARTFVALVAVLSLTACGADETPPAAGACPEGEPDCVDIPEPGDGDPDAVDEAALIAEAEALLGIGENDLPSGVRVSRRGTQSYPLTEDYVIGRFTVELDQPTGSTDYVVTRATVELTEAPHTVGR